MHLISDVRPDGVGATLRWRPWPLGVLGATRLVAAERSECRAGDIRVPLSREGGRYSTFAAAARSAFSSFFAATFSRALSATRSTFSSATCEIAGLWRRW